MFRIKRLTAWCILVIKQKIRQPSYWILLLLFCMLLAFLKRAEAQESQGVVVTVYMTPSETPEEKVFQSQIKRILTKKAETGLVRFVIAESEQDMIEQVARGDAECGYHIPGDLLEHIMDLKMKGQITVYTSPASSMEPMVREQLFAALFEVGSGEIFAKYVLEHPELDADYEQAMRAYRNRVGDGSTFCFTYESVATGKPEQQSNVAIPSTEKLVAVFAYLLLLLGIYDKKRNKSSCRYYFTGDRVGFFLAGSFQMLFAVLLILITGFLPGGIWAFLMLWGYGILLDVVCREQIALTAAIPLLLMGTLLFCPVFIDLAAYVPALGLLQNCFPVTWMLK